MKIRRLFHRALITALLLALPLGSAWATHRVEAEQAIAEAKAAHEKAKEADAASSDTQQMIERAEKLMPSRQFTKAKEIATKARMQDTYAYEQATSKEHADVAMSQRAEEAIEAAEKAREKADSVGGEWRDTAELIKEADSLAKSGKFEESIALAKKAQHQGELGYEQAMREKDAGFPSYVTMKQ
ncbi:hypothetical protein G3480_12355 [Thiorhodococcus mannitoliphagus]|uniref:SoxXA-binding protein n=1 Tax=Thiorhodococcus mannitoliphagus TaxID=329406 RepID=A0A6P1E011_9GAMM|nr:hypothetical protein [Thiorhodococcus mannitoliphagus]NEX21095.1 hypothetical protein [Thiorhodococcus mannitoliphagus]